VPKSVFNTQKIRLEKKNIRFIKKLNVFLMVSKAKKWSKRTFGQKMAKK
jgi:hypothetical protein